MALTIYLILLNNRYIYYIRSNQNIKEYIDYENYVKESIFISSQNMSEITWTHFR